MSEIGGVVGMAMKLETLQIAISARLKQYHEVEPHVSNEQWTYDVSVNANVPAADAASDTSCRLTAAIILEDAAKRLREGRVQREAVISRRERRASYVAHVLSLWQRKRRTKRMRLVSALALGLALPTLGQVPCYDYVSLGGADAEDAVDGAVRPAAGPGVGAPAGGGVAQYGAAGRRASGGDPGSVAGAGHAERGADGTDGRCRDSGMFDRLLSGDRDGDGMAPIHLRLEPAAPVGAGEATEAAAPATPQPPCSVFGPYPMKSARPPVCCDPERRANSSGGGPGLTGPPPDLVVGYGAETSISEGPQFGGEKARLASSADVPTAYAGTGSGRGAWHDIEATGDPGTRRRLRSVPPEGAAGRRITPDAEGPPRQDEASLAPESPLTIKVRAGAVSLFGADTEEPQRAVVLATRTRLTTAARPPLLLTETWLLPAPGRDLSLTDPDSGTVEALDHALTLAWRPRSTWNFSLALEWGVQAEARNPERAPQRIMAGVLVASTERAYLRILVGVDQRSNGSSWRSAGLVAGWLDVTQAGDVQVSVVGSVLVRKRPRVIVGLLAGWGG